MIILFPIWTNTQIVKITGKKRIPDVSLLIFTEQTTNILTEQTTKFCLIIINTSNKIIIYYIVNPAKQQMAATESDLPLRYNY